MLIMLPRLLLLTLVNNMSKIPNIVHLSKGLEMHSMPSIFQTKQQFKM